MQIEEQVNQIINSKKYKNMHQYIRALKDISGHALLNVEKPDDMGKLVRLRKNSETAKEYLKKYEQAL